MFPELEPSAEEKDAQVARVLDSVVLQNAPMLQKLLVFVTRHAREAELVEVNEITLATRVFGRPDDFDPTTDTSVRTAVYRLRTKLRDYYAGPGKLDPVVIEIPKGHYVPVFKKHPAVKDLAAGPVPATPPESSETEGFAAAAVLAPRRGFPTWFWRILIGSILVSAGLIAGFMLAGGREHAAARAELLDPMWRSFLGTHRTVLVTFSNAQLLQTDTRDLLRYDAGAVDARGAEVDPSLAAKHVAIPQFVRSHALFYENGYSGTGEVHAVFYLTRMLAKAGVDVLVKRVQLLTTDDLKAHDVILLGSSLENRAVAELHLTHSFTFDFPSGSHSSWAGRIVDKQPPVGGPASWSVERDPKSQALQTDYAVFGVLPGIVPNRRVMLLAGLTTSGTQGAAEFATTSSQVAEILSAVSQNDSTALFESVLEVKVVQGLDPVSIRRVAARRYAR